MKIDEFTEKRVKNFLDEVLQANLKDSEDKFYGGMYIGAIKALKLANIEINLDTESNEKKSN